MSPEARSAIGALLAGGAAYTLTPIAIGLATNLGFFDRPAGYKGHERPTPYLGGVAVVGAFGLALLLLGMGDPGRTLPLVGGMVVLWLVGTIDDRLNVPPLARVAVEVALGTAIWALGLGWDTGLGAAIDLALTCAWLVAVINAFNLFDNMDGAASTMALVAALCAGGLGASHGDDWVVLAAVLLSGACLGFLPYNLASPARIFLGDGGSMPVGFAVAILVMIAAAESASAGQSLLLGLLLVGVPATDTALVIFSRRRRGISILTGGRDHLTHRTHRWLRTARAVAIGLGAVQALVSVVAVFAIRGGSALFLVIVVLYGVAGAVAIAFLEMRYEEASETQGAPMDSGRRLTLPDAPGRAVAGLFGLATGLTPFAAGLYSPGKWIPVGLCVIVITTVGAIARPVAVSRAQALTVGVLLALGLFGLVSIAWAPSIAEATADANRWLVLAAIAVGAIVLARSERSAEWLTWGLATGITIVAASVVVRLAGSDPAQLFIGGRLNQPVGYVNAEGTAFLMGFWLWFGLAQDRARRTAAFALAVATLMAGLVLMTQSRGAALALIVSIIAVMAARGDRVRRAYALLACGGGVAIALPALVAVYNSGGAADDSRWAAAMLIVGALVVGALWWLGEAALARAAAGGGAAGPRIRRVAASLLVALAVVVAGLAVVRHAAITRYVDRQWNAFVNLTDNGASAGSTLHLASGAGYRYDYWRVAWRAFTDHPLRGVGAGNYDRPYFAMRATGEDVHQPHSLLMQELAELGAIGGILVLMLGAAIAVGVWRLRPGRLGRPALGIAATGVCVSWFVHTNGDWIHLFPGITGIAFAMLAILLRPTERVPSARTSSTGQAGFRLRPLRTAAVTLLLVVAVVSLSRSGLAQVFRDRARSDLPDRPGDAVVEANRSLRLDPEDPRTYYVKAAALARFNDAPGARRALQEALAKEPDNFVTWTLLGDLETRAGNVAEARQAYRRALRLNPQDATLRSLAGDASGTRG